MTRIVHCPGCKVLLVEPTAGIAIYQCGNCSKVLCAKYAVQSSTSVDKAEGQTPLHRQRDPSKAATTYADANDNSSPLDAPGLRSEAPLASSLLQDIQKLAIDAFPANAGQNGCTADGAESKFEFQSQVVASDQAWECEAGNYRPEVEVDKTCQNGSTTCEVQVNSSLEELRRPSLQITDMHYHANDSAYRRRSSNLGVDHPIRKSHPPLELPYVVCQHCKKLLQVPLTLPPRKKPIQKLRCGACQRISRFSVGLDAAHGSSSSSSLNLVPSSMEPVTTVSDTESEQSVTAYNYVKEANNGHKREMVNNLKLDMLTSSPVESSPSRGSAPASFHHPARLAGSGSKGYESAPEFISTRASDVSHHVSLSYGGAKTTDSRDSNDQSLPVAPCLHELFGYESPSQFFSRVGTHEQQMSKASPGSTKGIKRLLIRSIGDIGKHHHAQPMMVKINGKVIPNHLVRKAEEQAGPIHPGSYWYDHRAGFWGVMGGPCIGIVPPFIEEFKHPMQVSCAGGKTGVLVNGRELHQQDLDVLIKRGLPATTNAAYTIDIDGTVTDLYTETVIKCLGKLAPSMEKRGSGFGMYPLSRGL